MPAQPRPRSLPLPPPGRGQCPRPATVSAVTPAARRPYPRARHHRAATARARVRATSRPSLGVRTGEQGLEPQLRRPERRVLPLHHSPGVWVALGDPEASIGEETHAAGGSAGHSVRGPWEHTFVSTTRAAISALLEAELPAPAIARQLDLAPTTVRYHLQRLDQGGQVASTEVVASRGEAVRRSATRANVAGLLAQGVTRAEVARRLKLSKATVSYHARRLGESIDERCARRYDWSAVQAYYDAGHSVRKCIETFGFSAASWADAVRRGAVVARPSATPLAELLVPNTYRGRYNLKLRLLREGLKQNQCERCGVTDWCDEPLTLALHHINGVRNDNRLENLQLLCPNCHSQTRNYAGRNGRSGRAAGSDDRRSEQVESPTSPRGSHTESSADPSAAEVVCSRPEIAQAATSDADGALRSTPGRSRRPEAAAPDRPRRPARPAAGGRARGRRSGRRSRPPPRARRAGRRS
jgi:DNA-binding CsgD family transcriptional regulator